MVRAALVSSLLLLGCPSPAAPGTAAARDAGSTPAPAARPQAATGAAAPAAHPQAAADAPAAPAARCSAAALGAPPPQPALPAQVEATRQAIAAAARRCDYAALTALGSAQGQELKFSLGPDEDPAAYWRAREAEGAAPLAQFVRVLALPPALQEGQYLWPSAMAEQATDEDWRPLESLYSAARLAEMRELGGYQGTRLAIRTDGAWVLALEGD